LVGFVSEWPVPLAVCAGEISWKKKDHSPDCINAYKFCFYWKTVGTKNPPKNYKIRRQLLTVSSRTTSGTLWRMCLAPRALVHTSLEQRPRKKFPPKRALNPLGSKADSVEPKAKKPGSQLDH
jgi:hypothetical protein